MLSLTVSPFLKCSGFHVCDNFHRVQICISGMNNREVIDQVERGYRMAQPSHITYPESKTMTKEVALAQANVYKVS